MDYLDELYQRGLTNDMLAEEEYMNERRLVAAKRF